MLEVWSEDCEGQLEIVDMQPLAPLLHYALCLWVVEGGVGLPVQGVDEGDEEGPFVYLFTASNLTTIVVENKVCVCVRVCVCGACACVWCMCL